MVDLKFSNDLSSDAIVEVFNVIGEVVYRQNTTIANGALTEQINLSGAYGAGLYLVKVTAGENVYTQQLAVQK